MNLLIEAAEDLEETDDKVTKGRSIRSRRKGKKEQ